MDARGSIWDGAARVLASALFGAEAAHLEAAAADATREGMSGLLVEAQRLSLLSVEFKKGNFYEFIIATKFNANAAAQGSRLRALVTAALGHTTAPADILIVDGDRVVGSVQAKVSASSTYLTRVLSTEKYQDMMKVVPTDKVARVERISAGLSQRASERGSPLARHYAHTAAEVQGELRIGGVGSGRTDHDEALAAAEGPHQYAYEMSAGAIAREAVTAGTHAAVSGGILGAAVSFIRTRLSVSNGTTSEAEAIAQIAHDAAKYAARSGATAMLATTLRHAAPHPTLARPHLANALAAYLIDSGVIALAYIRGEITGEALAHQLGKNGCSTLSALYGAGAVGAALGPVGALLGSMACYLITSNVYQSCLAILERARLAEEESFRAIALFDEAREQLDEQRRAFEAHWRTQQVERDKQFQIIALTIDHGLAAQNPVATLAGLADLAALCGLTLRFPDFESFDAFMTYTDEPLPI